MTAGINEHLFNLPDLRFLPDFWKFLEMRVLYWGTTGELLDDEQLKDGGADTAWGEADFDILERAASNTSRERRPAIRTVGKNLARTTGELRVIHGAPQ